MEALALGKAFTLIEPGPVTLVTTRGDRGDNVMTITWTMVLDFTPHLAICTGPWNHSWAALRDRRDCVVAIPTVDLIDTVSLDLHAVPKIGAKDVGTLTIDDVKDVLKPIWATKTDTARRVRGRMESVFAWAMDEGCRQHDNPASVKALEVWIGNQKKAEAQNHPAIQQGDLPTWFAELRQREGMAARALELAVLCASRSGEVRGATWGEIDLAAKVLTIPAARMKMKKPHSVPLSEAAVALLKSLPNYEADHKNPKALIFPAPRGGVMSDMTISAVMKRMHEAKAKKDGKGWIDPHVLTQPEDPAEEPQPRPAVPHGLRSTFKDYCTVNQWDNLLSETALAHRCGNEVEQRYRRTDLVEQRRAMMTAWAGFCRGDAASTVVPLRAGVA